MKGLRQDLLRWGHRGNCRNKLRQNKQVAAGCCSLTDDVDSPHIQAAKTTHPLVAQSNLMLFEFTVAKAVWLQPAVKISSPVSKLDQSFMHQL